MLNDDLSNLDEVLKELEEKASSKSDSFEKALMDATDKIMKIQDLLKACSKIMDAYPSFEYCGCYRNSGYVTNIIIGRNSYVIIDRDRFFAAHIYPDSFRYSFNDREIEHIKGISLKQRDYFVGLVSNIHPEKIYSLVVDKVNKILEE